MRPPDRSRFTENILPVIEAQASAAAPQPPADAAQSCADRIVNAAPQANQANAREAAPAILDAARAQGLNPTNEVDRAQIAYMMATAEWESGFNGGITEGWNPAQVPAQGRYDAPGNHLGNDVYNPPPTDTRRTGGDGYRYRGRGYSQVTGRANYQAWGERLNIPDILDAPDQLATQENASRVLAQGMVEGSFRTRGLAPTPEHPRGQRVPASLGQYINANGTDFEGARNIINGDGSHTTARTGQQTVGQYIAGRAQAYNQALDGCEPPPPPQQP